MRIRGWRQRTVHVSLLHQLERPEAEHRCQRGRHRRVPPPPCRTIRPRLTWLRRRPRLGYAREPAALRAREQRLAVGRRLIRLGGVRMRAVGQQRLLYVGQLPGLPVRTAGDADDYINTPIMSGISAFPRCMHAATPAQPRCSRCCGSAAICGHRTAPTVHLLS